MDKEQVVCKILADKYGREMFEISNFINANISLDIDGVYIETNIGDLKKESIESIVELYSQEIDKLLENGGALL